MLRFSKTLTVVACLVAVALIWDATTQASDKTLPGTAPLTIEQPLDEFMVDGIDRFCLRELAASPERRAERWNRDYDSLEAYAKSVAPNRERFREYIGAVDSRLTAEHPNRFSFELISSLERPSAIARSNDVTVHIVRWQVLEGVTAEGLLLEPEGIRAAVVALPDADWTPEMFAGVEDGLPAQLQLPRRLASAGCLVAIPMIISRSDELSGSSVPVVGALVSAAGGFSFCLLSKHI